MVKQMMRYIRLLFISLLLFKASTAQTWQDTLSLINQAFTQYHPNMPGCQFSISRNGQIIFSKAWGMADLERNVPLTTNSVIEVGSISKQFTAAAILLLEQQGKLSLDDNVRKYIPELPDYGSPITLREMMHHTSGLRDWGAIAELTGWGRSTKFYTNDDALEIIASQKHLNNKPGNEFLYSNSNYNLFAIIVQRVSGLSLAAFTKKYIFEPAGMTHTQWRDDPNRIVPNRAIAYRTAPGFKTDSAYQIDMPNEYAYGNGGLLTTTEDLLKWTNFYQSGKFGTPSLLPEQIRIEPLNNGVINHYAAGLNIEKVMEWDNINHSGATASYEAYLETFPQLNLSFAIINNMSLFYITDPIKKVRKIFIPDKTKQSFSSDSGINLPAEKLNALAGVYLNERDGSTFHLSVENNHLILDSSLQLVTVSDKIFKSDNFHFEINGNKGMYLPASPVDTIPFIKVVQVNPSKKESSQYEGKYFSDETNSSIIIKLDSGRLMMHLNADKAYQLIPTYKDAFKVRELGCELQFIKNAQNKIVLMNIDADRARNVEFKKVL